MLRIKAILLLVLFAFSAVGNAFEVHYCKGEITDIAFVGTAFSSCNEVQVEENTKKCHSDETTNCCSSKKSNNGIEKSDCCQTEALQILNTVAFQNEVYSASTLLVAINLYLPYFFFDGNNESQLLAHYKVPDISEDIPIRLQRFLI